MSDRMEKETALRAERMEKERDLHNMKCNLNEVSMEIGEIEKQLVTSNEKIEEIEKQLVTSKEELDREKRSKELEVTRLKHEREKSQSMIENLNQKIKELNHQLHYKN